MARTSTRTKLVVHEPTGWLVDPKRGHIYTPHLHGADHLVRVVGSPNMKGQMASTRWREGRRVSWLLKNVVWEAVNGRRPEGMYVLVLNGRQDDLRIKNLELRDRALRNSAKSIGVVTMSKLTPEQVLDIWRTRGAISHAKTARQYGVSPDTIARIRNGRSWSHLTGSVG